MSLLLNKPCSTSGTSLYEIDETFILLFQLKMLEIFLHLRKKQYCSLTAFILQSLWESRTPRLQDLTTQQGSPFCAASRSGTTEPNRQTGEITTIFWGSVSESNSLSAGTSAQAQCAGTHRCSRVPPNYSARRDHLSHGSTHTLLPLAKQVSFIFPLTWKGKYGLNGISNFIRNYSTQRLKLFYIQAWI